MPIYPFTPAGVTSKTTDLYALDDGDLFIQAKMLRDDIYSWLVANFSLSEKQKTYISSAPAIVQFSWGSLISAAIIQKAEIKMKPAPGDYGPPRRTKQIGIDIGGKNKYFPGATGPGTIEGELIVSIDYELVD